MKDGHRIVSQQLRWPYVFPVSVSCESRKDDLSLVFVVVPTTIFVETVLTSDACVITNYWIVITTYDLHERQEVATDENNWYSPLPFLQNFKIHFYRKHPSRVKSTSVSSRQFSYLQSNEAVLSEVEHYNYRAVDYRVQFPNNLEFKNILPSKVNDHKHMCGEKTLSRILDLTSEKIPFINTWDT